MNSKVEPNFRFSRDNFAPLTDILHSETIRNDSFSLDVKKDAEKAQSKSKKKKGHQEKPEAEVSKPKLDAKPVITEPDPAAGTVAETTSGQDPGIDA